MVTVDKENSVADTKDKYAKLEQKVLRIEKELNKRQSAEAKLIEYATNETKFLQVIKAQEKRADYLANRLQALINRECVLTEVSRYVRGLGSADLIVQFHLQLMKAYNWGDDFWEQQRSGSFTIKDWFELIMKVDDPVPAEALQSQLFEVL